jgi:hypothetical protein
MAIFNEKGHRVIQSSNRSSSARNLDSGMDGLNESLYTPEVGPSGLSGLNYLDPYAFRQISFPSDITTNPARGHYMLFYVNVQNKTKYKHTGATDGLEVGNRVITRTAMTAEDRMSWAGGEGYDMDDFFQSSTTNTQGTGSYKYISVKAGGLGNLDSSDVTYLAKGRPAGHGATSGMESWAPTTTRITDSIALYLPANITSDLTAEYTAAEQGLIGFALASGFDFKQNWDEDDFEGAANALKGFIGSLGKDVLVRGISGLADVIETGADTYGGINKYFGRALNPFMEVIFDDIKQRSFTYRFKFQPKDEKERDDVQEIIKLFRFHMAPELQPGNMRFLGIPATFDIHYMYQTSDYGESGSMDWRNARENDFYNKIATCVLTNVSVDYTPDGVKSFRDGSPTAITMSLSFKETELLTKDKINKGY